MQYKDVTLERLFSLCGRLHTIGATPSLKLNACPLSSSAPPIENGTAALGVKHGRES